MKFAVHALMALNHLAGLLEDERTGSMKGGEVGITSGFVPELDGKFGAGGRQAVMLLAFSRLPVIGKELIPGAGPGGPARTRASAPRGEIRIPIIAQELIPGAGPGGPARTRASAPRVRLGYSSSIRN